MVIGRADRVWMTVTVKGNTYPILFKCLVNKDTNLYKILMANDRTMVILQHHLGYDS